MYSMNAYPIMLELERGKQIIDVQQIKEEFWFVYGIEFLDNNLTNNRQNN